MEVYFILGFCVIWLLLFFRSLIQRHSSLNKKHINEYSFQNYAKFYGEIVPKEAGFDQKINTIYQLIQGHVYDISEIAKKSGCTLPECVLKIRYLKNKRMIEDYYIDTRNFLLVPCSEEDQRLLELYSPYIYGSHIQIAEMASVISNPNLLTVEELRQKILRDLLYLDRKGLLNGVKIDDIDGRNLYYTIEKRKVHSDYETVHCPNCGALNDVEIAGKVRCSYCQTIIKGKNWKEG